MTHEGPAIQIVGGQGPVGLVTVRVIEAVTGERDLGTWPFTGVPIGEEGALEPMTTGLIILGPAISIFPGPAFASAGNTKWVWKTPETAGRAWTTWCELFIGGRAVLGDGVSLFKPARERTDQSSLLGGLLHDLRDCRSAFERERFVRLLTTYVDSLAFHPLLVACDIKAADDWSPAGTLASAFRSFEEALVGRQAASAPMTLHGYWPRLCEAYRTQLARRTAATVTDVRDIFAGSVELFKQQAADRSIV